MFRIAGCRLSTSVVSRTTFRAMNRTTLQATDQFARWNSNDSKATGDAPPIVGSEPPAKELTPEQIKKAQRREWFDKMDDLQRDWDAKVVSYEEFLPRTQNPTPDVFIIDVREPDEVIQGMIPGAVNLPLSVLSSALHMRHVEFKEKFGFEKPRKNQEVVFYCRSGRRSSTASDVAKRNGWEKDKIFNYKGSWLEWTAKQNESQKPQA